MPVTIGSSTDYSCGDPPRPTPQDVTSLRVTLPVRATSSLSLMPVATFLIISFYQDEPFPTLAQVRDNSGSCPISMICFTSG